MKVQVKGVGVKLAGKWCYKGDIAEITEKEYEFNKEYLEVLEGEKKSTKTNNEQKPKTAGETEDIELKVLREKAKDLGIKGASNMKKETLEAKIAELEKQLETSEDDEETGEDEDTGEDGEGKKENDGVTADGE